MNRIYQGRVSKLELPDPDLQIPSKIEVCHQKEKNPIQPQAHTNQQPIKQKA